MTLKNIDVLPLLVSIVLIATGCAAVWFSMQYSYTGFSRSFPTIPQVGNLGVIFAILAFVMVSMVTVLAKRGLFMNSMLAGLLALMCCAIDVMGNFQALHSDSIIDTKQYQELSAGYSTAVDALERQLKEAASIETVRELMVSDEPEGIKKAQLYLQSRGLYDGRIDGERGGLTIEATTSHGQYLAERSEELVSLIASNEAIIAKGAPILPKDRTIYSWLFAVSLTLFGAACSYFGSILYYIGTGADREKAAETEEDELDARVADALENELIQLRSEVGLTGDANGLRLIK